MSVELAQEFGLALRQLAVKAFPQASPEVQDVLAHDHFVSAFSGEAQAHL